MRASLSSVFAPSRQDASDIRKINAMRLEFDRLSDDELQRLARETRSLLTLFAVTAVLAARTLGQHMFDVQLQGSLALARGSVVEMQTGERKTLAAVPAVAWYARAGRSVHVITANDYLARRHVDPNITTAQPFGTWTGRILHGFHRKFKNKAFRG